MKRAHAGPLMREDAGDSEQTLRTGVEHQLHRGALPAVHARGPSSCAGNSTTYRSTRPPGPWERPLRRGRPTRRRAPARLAARGPCPARPRGHLARRSAGPRTRRPQPDGAGTAIPDRGRRVRWRSAPGRPRWRCCQSSARRFLSVSCASAREVPATTTSSRVLGHPPAKMTCKSVPAGGPPRTRSPERRRGGRLTCRVREGGRTCDDTVAGEELTANGRDGGAGCRSGASVELGREKVEGFLKDRMFAVVRPATVRLRTRAAAARGRRAG